jgi:hypothetical protein
MPYTPLKTSRQAYDSAYFDMENEHPPEEDYITRPMSPHKPFRLSDHLRPTRETLQPPPEFYKDTFQSRIQALFLPSIFGSSNDLKNAGLGGFGGFGGPSVFARKKSMKYPGMGSGGGVEEEGKFHKHYKQHLKLLQANGCEEDFDDDMDSTPIGATPGVVTRRSRNNGPGGGSVNIGGRVVRPIFPTDLTNWTPPKAKDFKNFVSVIASGEDFVFRNDPLVDVRKSVMGNPSSPGGSGGGDDNGGVGVDSNRVTIMHRNNGGDNSKVGKTVRIGSARRVGSARTGSARARSARARSAKRRSGANGAANGVTYVEGGGPSNLRRRSQLPDSNGGNNLAMRKMSMMRAKTPISTIDGRDTSDLVPLDLPFALLRWRQAIYLVLKANKLRREVLEDKTINMRLATEQGRFGAMMRDKVDVVGALRVKKVMELSPNSREEKDLDLLDSVLGKFKAFVKLPPSVSGIIFCVIGQKNLTLLIFFRLATSYTTAPNSKSFLGAPFSSAKVFKLDIGTSSS